MNRTEALLASAREHGIDLLAESIVLNESGTDFIAVHAVDRENVAWVLRLPRRPDVLERAAAESRVLALLRNRLPVMVPDWRVNTDRLIAYPRLPGTPAATIDPVALRYVRYINQESPAGVFVDSLGDAIAALHAIDGNEAARAGVRVRGRNEVRELLAQHMDQTRTLVEVAEPVWRRWRNWLAEDSFWPPEWTLVHGDLHPGHMLVDEGHRLTGLIDWTEAEVTDPSIDFALYYGIMGESALDKLLERYWKAGGRAWPRMRDHIIERWYAAPVMFAMFSQVSGVEGHLELARGLLASYEASA